MSDEEERTAINWVQVVAGALAAVSSAVLLSTLGVAGTMIGAALGSVIASVASAWYGRGLDASRQQVAAQAAALKRVSAARSRLDDAVSARNRGETGDTGLLRADQALGEAEEALEQANQAALGEDGPVDGQPPSGDDVAEPLPADEPEGSGSARQLPWKRIVLVSAVIFVAAMAAITVFELTTGRAVSTFTGGSDKDTGSTVPGVQNAPARDREQPMDGRTEPSDGSRETDEPGDPGETEEPTGDVTPSEEPSTEPSDEPTPSVTPSETVLPTTPTSSEPAPTDGSTG